MPKNLQKNRYAGWTPETHQRFESLYEVGTKDECWLWQGLVVNHGKSSMTPVFTAPGAGNRNKSAALFVYDMVIGLPKTDKFIKSRRTCDERMCVNPYHRTLYFHEMPKRLGPKKKRKVKPRKQCRNKHDLTKAGAKTPKGHCRECKRIQNLKYQQKNGHGTRLDRKPWDEAARELLDQY